MLEKPKFSVVIPAYNSERFILGTLNSVFSQAYRNFEVIVSDDGSSDRTRKIVKDAFKHNGNFSSKLIEGKHLGPAGNRNRGISEAQGSWIAFLDSDDLWNREKLGMVAENIDRDPDIDLWCHSEIMIRNNKSVLLEHFKKFNSKISPFLSLYRNNSLSPSAITVKKEILLKAGLFDIDKRLPPAEDFELWLRLARFAKIGYIKDILGTYIVREGGISLNSARALKAYMLIAHKSRNELKKVTKFYLIEELRFRLRAFVVAGLNLIRAGVLNNPFKK